MRPEAMAQYFEIHPETPQKRLIHQAAELIRNGGVIAYPTDSSYALGCQLDDKQAAERIRRIRRVGPDHNFTLVVKDLSEIAQYARVDNEQYRMLKALTPGPFTFILPATREVPRRLQHPKRKTIGIRVPDYPIVLALLEELQEPIMSSTLIMPEDEMPMSDAQAIRETLQHDVDLVIDGGPCGMEPTTVIEWTEDVPRIVRQGKPDSRLDFLQ
ncbi:MAG TPA: L-threonylcarbamoyladenylate synthase [Arenicellales bacterium]|nr:L-threonylcarbamoyladenylate synthase [Arenicellales bacterium]